MKAFHNEKMKGSKLIETVIKIGLWAFVEVRRTNKTQFELVIVLMKTGVILSKLSQNSTHIPDDYFKQVK